MKWVAIHCWVLVLGLMAQTAASLEESELLDIRLVNGSSPNEGRVELLIQRGDDNAILGAVCDDHWGLDEASWVCDRLGYRAAAFAAGGTRFGRGTEPLVLRLNKDCDTEDDFFRCDLDYDTSDCDQGSAAGVICQKPGYLDCANARTPEVDRTRIGDVRDITTADECVAICRNVEGALLAFQRSRDECRCLSDLPDDLTSRPLCDSPCSGDPEQVCGEEGRGGGDTHVIYNVTEGFCPPFTDPYLIVSGTRRFGDVVTLSCPPELLLRGASSLQCTGDPQTYDWDGNIPTCVDPDDLTTKATETTPATVALATVFDDVNQTAMTVAVTYDPTYDKNIGGINPLIIAVPILVVAVFAAVIILLIILKARKRGVETKNTSGAKGIETQAYDDGYDDIGCPGTRNDGAKYYEIELNSKNGLQSDVGRDEENEDGLIPNVLYRSSGDFAVSPTSKSPQQDLTSPNGSPNIGKVDKTAKEGAMFNNALYNITDEICGAPNKSEADSASFGVSTANQKGPADSGNNGALIENVLYIPAEEDQPKNDAPKYYELNASLETSGTSGPKYYEVTPNLPRESPKVDSTNEAEYIYVLGD